MILLETQKRISVHLKQPIHNQLIEFQS